MKLNSDAHQKQIHKLFEVAVGQESVNEGVYKLSS